MSQAQRIDVRNTPDCLWQNAVVGSVVRFSFHISSTRALVFNFGDVS